MRLFARFSNTVSKGGVVLIYCRAGMSRSASLCIAYFMKYHKMSREDAYQFVRQKRPIICPNPGFNMQLRDYEAKLKFRSSGIKRKFEESQFSYAEYEEIVAFEVMDFDSLPKLKPRPKPRIMKPKVFVPDPTQGETGLIAQSYTIAQVGICLPDSAQPAQVDATEVPKAAQPAHAAQPGHKPSRRGARPKRPASMPVRPRTPANVPIAQPGHAWAYHDPLSVAESLEVDQRENAPPLTVKKGSLKKRPFSKISEPTKVAVSFQTIPWALCRTFEGRKANFNAEVPRYTVFADLHLPLAEKSQEISFECHPPLVKATQPLEIYEKAKVKVTCPRSMPTQFKPVICDCPGLYAAQPKVDYFRQNIPSRFAKSRATIKMPGLQIKAIPDEYKKRPVPNLDLNFLYVAQRIMPNPVFQKAETWAKPSGNPGLARAQTTLWAPKLMVATSSVELIHEKVERDGIQAFKSAYLLTVPLRKVVLATFVTVQETIPMGSNEPLPPEKIMPAKEYPYYSPVRKSSMILSLVKATKLPTVEANVYVTKVNEFKRKTYYEPELHWAAMRCEYDPSLVEQYTRPLEDLRRPDKAKIMWHRSLLDNKFRLVYSTTVHVDLSSVELVNFSDRSFWA